VRSGVAVATQCLQIAQFMETHPAPGKHGNRLTMMYNEVGIRPATLATVVVSFKSLDP